MLQTISLCSKSAYWNEFSRTLKTGVMMINSAYILQYINNINI